MAAEPAHTEMERRLAEVREADLRRWVGAFAGLRHGQREPGALAARADLLVRELEGMGLEASREPVPYAGRTYHNILAEVRGQEAGLPSLLIGAHYDAAWGTPGADDNASGVAALLGAARALAAAPLRRTVRLAGFSIEEPQDAWDRACRHGSRHHAREARRRGETLAGVYILEMVGYTDPTPGSQRIPVRLPVAPEAGTFLGAVGTRRSRHLLKGFREAAARHAPGLQVITHAVALRGFFLPMSRMSDHAPFWDRGFPAVMLTDTAFLRNPHYHQPTDTPETLDFAFLTQVTRALAAAAAET